MKPMFLLGMLTLLSPTFASAKIYNWVDEHGVTHFSDQPHKGAKEIQIEDMTIYDNESEQVLDSSTTTNEKNTEDTNSVPVLNYKSISLVGIQDEQTFWNGQANDLTISVALEPQLQETHHVVVLLDGNPVANLNGTFNLGIVDRGEHSIVAQVLDKDNKVIISSDTLSFYVQRTVVGG